MTAFQLSGLFAGTLLLASASVAFGSDFNPQPDPPRHGVTTTTPTHAADFNPQPDPPRHGVTPGTHAADFNPPPDPPGRHAVNNSLDFNPQPDPPGKHGAATAASGCPAGHGANRDAASGLPSGKRTTGSDYAAAGSASSGDAMQHCGK